MKSATGRIRNDWGIGMIGVFDSGIGGLTVLRSLQKALPETGFMYVGDHANAPYGTKSDEEIHKLTRASVQKMFDAGCDLVILACNTASAVALHDLQVEWLPQIDPSGKKRVLGVFVPIIEAMTDRDWGDNSPPSHTGLRNVLLFATEASVRSGAFARELKFRARDVKVEAVACPDLVPAIECGDAGAAEAAVIKYVKQGLERIPSPQTAALGCTHYPLANKYFAAHLPQDCMVFSQPFIVAKSLVNYVDRHPDFMNKIGQTVYFTSGNASEVSEEASKLFGVDIQFEQF